MNTRCNPNRTTSGELNMQPFINFMVILGTALIAFVEFSHVGVLAVKSEKNRGASEYNRVTDAIPENVNLLKLTAIITDSTITFGAANGFLPTIRYSTVLQKGGETELVLMDEQGLTINSLHTKDGRTLRAENGDLVRSVAKGDNVFIEGEDSPVMVTDPARYVQLPVNCISEVQQQLRAIHAKFANVEDANGIIVAAEDRVVYDKIVKIIDASSLAGFTDVSISKPRTL